MQSANAWLSNIIQIILETIISKYNILKQKWLIIIQLKVIIKNNREKARVKIK